MSRIAKVAAVAAGAGAMVMTGTGLALADAGANGVATDSPGIVAGDNVQVPIHLPANVCGNTVNIVGVLNPAVGNTCVNADDIDVDDHHQEHHHGGGHHRK